MKPLNTTVVTAAALLGASVWVAFRGANDEPYVTFRASDAIIQIGVASALIAFWIAWSIFVTADVHKRRKPRFWLLALILSGLAILLLYQSPAGYVSDIVRWQTTSQ